MKKNFGGTLSLNQISAVMISSSDKVSLYDFSKKKVYDGSDTLKIVGNDCITLEESAAAMLECLVDPGESINDKKYKDLHNLIKLYKLFKDIAR